MDLEQNNSDNFAQQTKVASVANILDGKNEPETEKEKQVSRKEEQNEQNQVNIETQKEQGKDGENEQQKQPSGDDVEEEEQAQATTFKEMADKLGMSKKELYGVEINLGNDSIVSLGDLKDAFKDYESIKDGQEKFEATKTHEQNEMMIARRQMDQLVQLGQQTGNLTPQIIDQLDKIHGDNVTRERNALLTTLPEWRDSNVRQTDYHEMGQLLGQYGFTQTELEGVVDHRLIKFVHDMTKRVNLVKKATKKAGIPANTGKQSKHFQPKQTKQNTPRTDSRNDKIKAVGELLN